MAAVTNQLSDQVRLVEIVLAMKETPGGRTATGLAI